MQLRYVFSELRAGLRRNLTMHLAVILTLFVSLSLAGCGIMLQREASLTVDTLGNQLQIQVNLCTDGDKNRMPNCVSGAVTDQQRDDIESTLEQSPEVAQVDYVSQQEGYEKAKRYAPENYFKGPKPLVTVKSFPAAFLVTLEDPDKADGVKSAVEGLPGVRTIEDQREALGQIYRIIGALKYGSWIGAGVLLLAALLLVANTIRLAAVARRREIEIMRLVGASTLYIALPFLLEAVVAAAVGVLLAAGALAAFQRFAIDKGLGEAIDFLPWIDWSDWLKAIIGAFPPGIAWLGAALTLIPTLLLTRKYVKV